MQKVKRRYFFSRLVFKNGGPARAHGFYVEGVFFRRAASYYTGEGVRDSAYKARQAASAMQWRAIKARACIDAQERRTAREPSFAEARAAYEEANPGMTLLKQGRTVDGKPNGRFA